MQITTETQQGWTNDRQDKEMTRISRNSRNNRKDQDIQPSKGVERKNNATKQHDKKESGDSINLEEVNDFLDRKQNTKCQFRKRATEKDKEDAEINLDEIDDFLDERGDSVDTQAKKKRERGNSKVILKRLIKSEKSILSQLKIKHKFSID